MNLSKQQQQAYTRLQEALEVMTDVVDDPVVIREKMQPRIDKFVTETGGEIKVKLVGAGIPTIELIDLSKDSMKTTLDASQTLYLRARFESVLISVSAAYKDTYAHSNEMIADALQGMAQKVRGLPFEIVAKGACNIDELLGLSHSDAGDKDDDDQGGADDAGVAAAAAAGAVATGGAVGLASAVVSTTFGADLEPAKPAADAAEVVDAAAEPAPADGDVIELLPAPADAESAV
ncbi:hypothetical protein DV532_30005 (plasmid) [Pseudomonas sp. Leaf58]|uniref:hypothetical protein n=1 Tax=Pseudomonas sp. Leaf58 TaxID=1736226 RepID=UPI0006FC9D44|nr:hypothetical protein [Pseudomonas sp. Leaf58]AYG48464.1 hypothetical protein DV532_30005 [Pseudomonas sp. Leaf58]KQN61991.1 hypothetical protein ASF02_07325 [Pseudomonas sp. Leaf58]